ncbi:MAG: hypothetical protein ACRC1K_19810 [Planctomycetia bacterium]
MAKSRRTFTREFGLQVVEASLRGVMKTAFVVGAFGAAHFPAANEFPSVVFVGRRFESFERPLEPFVGRRAPPPGMERILSGRRLIAGGSCSRTSFFNSSVFSPC